MNDDNFNLIEKYIPHSYVQQGKEAHRNLEKNIRQLLEQRKIPSNGWSELWIKHLLQELSLMDSNNFPDNCGVGEREGRIVSRLVSERHFYLSHGVGRSGDIAEVQPKAAGSSLLAKLATSFALDAIKMQGVKSATACLLVPVATGMALVLTMLTLKEFRPKAKYVIWPRIDQKSCFKSILTAGLEPVIIENVLCNDHLETDILKIKSAITNLGSENILCVLTTTSCFAPRLPDKLEDVAVLCKEHDIPHVVNNAYGVQSTKCMHLIQQAVRVGRVDAFIQSTDKNFMVPVGGAIIAGFDKEFIQSIGKMYPGRASASPTIDFFITMLSVGESGYNNLLKERKELYDYLKDGLCEIGARFGERCMETKANQISLALSLERLDVSSEGEQRSITEFGSYLFKRCVSGTRVVTPYDSKTIGRYTFKGWGSHHNAYPTSYLTAAASIGMTKTDVDQFLKRLDKTFKLFIKDPLLLSIDNKDSTIASHLQHSLAHHSQPDLRPTKSMTEKIKSANDNYAPKARSGSFSSYQSLLNEEKCNGDIGNDNYINNSGGETQIMENGNKYYSDSLLLTHDPSQDNSRETALSRDASLTRLRDDLAQQLVIPSDIASEKMSFLIDI